MTPSSVFEKLPVVPIFAKPRVPCLSSPLCWAQGTLCPPLCIWPKNFKICFYRLKVIVLMKWNFFNNFQKVWIGLRLFLNFWKISCRLPFAKPRVPRLSSPLCWAQGTLCPPPLFAFDQKILKYVFYRLKVIVLMKWNFFNKFQKVWTSLRWFLDFWKISCRLPFAKGGCKHSQRGASCEDWKSAFSLGYPVCHPPFAEPKVLCAPPPFIDRK
jgi:hypothetical protein